MGIPSKVVGAGNNSAAQNVFKVIFSEATSDIPTLEAWDDYSFSTILHEIFTGTTGNGSKPMLCAVATTDAAPVSAWKSDPVAGGATINRLKGNTNYVNLASAPISASGYVLFNLNWEIPSDASVPSDMAAIFLIRFSYTGAAPVLTWQFNDYEAGGSEGTPSWTTMTSGVAGNTIKSADSGATSSTVVVHRPLSGVIDAGEVWVVA